MKAREVVQNMVKWIVCKTGVTMFKIFNRYEYLHDASACAILELTNPEDVVARLKENMGDRFGKITVREHAMRYKTFYIACSQSFVLVTPYVKVLFNDFHGFTELEFYATKKGRNEIYGIDEALYELSRAVDYYAREEAEA